MRKIFYMTLAVIGTAVLMACKKPEAFVFIQISDPQFGFMEKNDSFPRSAAMLEKVVSVINEVRPAFVVCTGDIMHQPSTEVEYTEYMRITSGISKDIRLYNLPGNHDIIEKGRTLVDNLERYRTRFGENHFAFIHQGCGFVGYDSNFILYGHIPSIAELEERQYEWLSSVLEEYSRSCRQIFVFTHCPIVEDDSFTKVTYFSYKEPWRQKYIDLFNKYGVKALIAGHRHKPSTFFPGNFIQITAGACGCAPLDGASSGIEVFKVYKDNFTYNFLPAESVADYVRSLK